MMVMDKRFHPPLRTFFQLRKIRTFGLLAGLMLVSGGLIGGLKDGTPGQPN